MAHYQELRSFLCITLDCLKWIYAYLKATLGDQTLIHSIEVTCAL